MRPSRTSIVLALALCAGWSGSAWGAQQPSSGGITQLPQELEVTSDNMRQGEDGSLELSGSVTIVWRQSRLQADRMALTDQRYVVAEGNVLVVWGENRIFGERMTYDLEKERGIIENAIGYVQSEFLFWAKSVEKIGDRKVHLKSATVTSCTQPVPYWSFAVSSATITIDGYARMWNIRLRARKVPFFYLPYMLWPVKKDRAAGLLMPEFQSNEERGRAITQQLFIPLGRSADLTLLGRYYTESGFGGGGELRFIPNRRGAASLAGFYIEDQVGSGPTVPPGTGRYSVTYNQTQEFLNGFRMVADINLVSDFNYFSDYERDLTRASSPTILARLELTKNGRWASTNVRLQRREQLLSGGETLVQQTMPEIEMRGRSLRLGKSPFYLAYESSIALIQQNGEQSGQPIDADYIRGDLFPQISIPLSPAPWIDITPNLLYRVTHYTQRETDVDIAGETLRLVVDEPITRSLWGANVEIVGPKFTRVFSGGDDSSRRQYKHSIEPRIVYGFQEEYDEFDDVIAYDEVDVYSGAGSSMTYALAQRLFAKKAQSLPTPSPVVVETIVLPDGTTSEAPLTLINDDLPRATIGEESVDAPHRAIEVASLEIRQGRSFDRDDISIADLDRDGVVDTTSPYSSIQATGRYNPNPHTTLDLRTDYHILYDQFSGATLSGGLRNQRAGARFSLVYRNGLGVQEISDNVFRDIEDDTQMRLTGGLNLLNGKLRLDIDGSVVFNRGAGRTDHSRYALAGPVPHPVLHFSGRADQS